MIARIEMAWTGDTWIAIGAACAACAALATALHALSGRKPERRRRMAVLALLGGCTAFLLAGFFMRVDGERLLDLFPPDTTRDEPTLLAAILLVSAFSTGFAVLASMLARMEGKHGSVMPDIIALIAAATQIAAALVV